MLFSSRHGLFSWTPAVWLGVLGTLLYVRRNRWWAVPALLTFAIWSGSMAARTTGPAGWAFGGRRFTSALAAFAPGFATALLGPAAPLVVLAPAVALAIGWNTLLMTQFQRDLVPKDEAVRFDMMVRQQADSRQGRRYLYPFAFPANVWFAWREGLPVDKYDLLGAEPLAPRDVSAAERLGLAVSDRRLGRRRGRSLRFRHYLNGAAGTILVPLDVPAMSSSCSTSKRAPRGPRAAARRRSAWRSTIASSGTS